MILINIKIFVGRSISLSSSGAIFLRHHPPGHCPSILAYDR